jgi:hypothetical protein
MPLARMTTRRRRGVGRVVWIKDWIWHLALAMYNPTATTMEVPERVQRCRVSPMFV